MRMPTELRPTLDHLGEPSVGGTDSVGRAEKEALCPTRGHRHRLGRGRGPRLAHASPGHLQVTAQGHGYPG